MLQGPACGGQRGERLSLRARRARGQAGRARGPAPSLNQFPFAAADAAGRVAPDPSSLFSQGAPPNKFSLGGIAPVLKPSQPSGRGLQRFSCCLLCGIWEDFDQAATEPPAAPRGCCHIATNLPAIETPSLSSEVAHRVRSDLGQPSPYYLRT